MTFTRATYQRRLRALRTELDAMTKHRTELLTAGRLARSDGRLAREERFGELVMLRHQIATLRRAIARHETLAREATR